MDVKTELLFLIAGLLLIISGFILGLYVTAKYRTALMPDLPSWRAWRVRREWFASEHGYRLYRLSGLMMGVGALLGFIVFFSKARSD